MKRLMLFALFAAPAFCAWPNGYAYRSTITIDPSRVSGTSDLANFPLLVSLTDNDLKNTGNGGRVVNSSGYDIVFASDASGSTPLFWEIESYDGAAGSGVFWVKVPAVSHTASTTIYMFYGKAGVSAFQSTASSVWDANYKAVWHLKETTNGPYADSTASGLTLTGTSTRGTGKIGSGQVFDGSSNALSVSDGATLDFVSGDFTLEYWVSPTSNSTRQLLQTKGLYAYGGYYVDFGADASVSLACEAPGAESRITAPAAYDAGAWQHFVIVRAAGGDAIYKNGQALTLSADACTIASASNSATVIGSYSVPAFFLGGSADEIRMSNVARSAGWVGTEYHNQQSPGAFYSVTFGATPGVSNAVVQGQVILW